VGYAIWRAWPSNGKLTLNAPAEDGAKDGATDGAIDGAIEGAMECAIDGAKDCAKGVPMLTSSMKVGPPMYLPCTVTHPSGWIGIRTSPVGSSTVSAVCTSMSLGKCRRISLLFTSCVSLTMTSGKSGLWSTLHR